MKNLFFGFLILLLLCKSILSSEIISNIEDHWNQIDTMSGQFKQEDSDGIISYGSFYFVKPYKSKFVYNDRSENIITISFLLWAYYK